MTAKSFQDLLVWKKAHTWVLGVYALTHRFPKEELFGLTSQLRRAAISVPANIAEGFRRRTKPEKARFYNISQSSLEESRYYLLLARDLQYAARDELSTAADEISRMLDAYVRTLIRPAN